MEATGGIAMKSEVPLHNGPELVDNGPPCFICNNDRANDFDRVWTVSVSIIHSFSRRKISNRTKARE